MIHHLGKGTLTMFNEKGDEICSCETERQQLKFDFKFTPTKTFRCTIGTADISQKQLQKAFYGKGWNFPLLRNDIGLVQVKC